MAMKSKTCPCTYSQMPSSSHKHTRLLPHHSFPQQEGVLHTGSCLQSVGAILTPDTELAVLLKGNISGTLFVHQWHNHQPMFNSVFTRATLKHYHVHSEQCAYFYLYIYNWRLLGFQITFYLVLSFPKSRNQK